MKLSTPLLLVAALSTSVGCQKDSDKKKDDTKTTDAKKAADAKGAKANLPHQREQIPAPPDVAAPPADAKKTDKGVSYKVQTPAPAPGDKPGPNDTVVVHYTGWTTDGKMFDSSVTKERPSELALNQDIPGRSEAIQTMVVGQKDRVW